MHHLGRHIFKLCLAKKLSKSLCNCLFFTHDLAPRLIFNVVDLNAPSLRNMFSRLTYEDVLRPSNIFAFQ